MRQVSCVLACALIGSFCSGADPQPSPWVTIRGRVELPAGVAVPARAALPVNVDKAHCLGKGAILENTVLIDPKTRGVANVVVWLRPNNPNPKAVFDATEIHPDDQKRKPADVVIDQPCCVFLPRVTACRVGDTIVVKNPAPVAHNFFWTSTNNGEVNKVIAAGDSYRLPNPLVAESTPIPYRCTIHPWMGGVVRVFDHPYFAVTDESGAFEIRNAPAGNFRLVVWHEAVGFRGGVPGKAGEPIAVKDAGKGTMDLPPIAFDVTPKDAK